MRFRLPLLACSSARYVVTTLLCVQHTKQHTTAFKPPVELLVVKNTPGRKGLEVDRPLIPSRAFCPPSDASVCRLNLTQEYFDREMAAVDAEVER